MASTSPALPAGYRPTPAQIVFFTLVWAAKLGVAWQNAAGPLRAGSDVLPPALVEEHAAQVAGHLDGWGVAVSGLQRGEAHEWELLRIQLDKALRGRSPDQADDALQEALLTLYRMVSRMTPGDAIDRAVDVAALAAACFPAHAAAYRFDRPFYPYAKRIAENQLYTQFRQRRRLDKDALPLDEWEEVLLAPEQVQGDGDGAPALRQVLAEEHQRLLYLIGSQLTPKPRQVVLATLAARPQFWAALHALDIPAPNELAPLPADSDDAGLAQRLGMSENNLRVHRAHGKQAIAAVDPFQALLLENLMAAEVRTAQYRRLLAALWDRELGSGE
jgi:DNA-directed RNA polymerase specialized sigma24 family protein